MTRTPPLEKTISLTIQLVICYILVFAVTTALLLFLSTYDIILFQDESIMYGMNCIVSMVGAGFVLLCACMCTIDLSTVTVVKTIDKKEEVQSSLDDFQNKDRKP